MGLENSTMFYERCFLTIEGKPESTEGHGWTA